MLFGLPPGRLPRRDTELATRALPASVAKRRLIEVVRDLALDDRAFAGVIVPVLDEFSRSVAKGEWQASVSALCRLRRAHPDLKMTLPPPEAFSASTGAA